MNRMLKPLALAGCMVLASALSLSGEDAAEDGEENEKKEIRVLWIGASSTNHRLMRCTEAMVNSGGKFTMTSVRAKNPRKPGDPSHAQQIREGNYDFVILQISRILVKDAESYNGGRAFGGYICNAARASGAVPILFEHYFRNEKTVNADQDKLTTLCREIAVRYNARYAPTGAAWKAVGAVKGYDYLLNIPAGDRGHAGHNGNYLFACCFLSTITGESPVGNPVREVLSARKEELDGEEVVTRYTHEVPDDDAAFMQKVAWEQVQRHARDIVEAGAARHGQ